MPLLLAITAYNFMSKQLVLIGGTANARLTAEVAKVLKITAIPVEVKKFKDGETYCRITQSVRGAEVFVIQSTSAPVNDNLLELLIIIDALKRASVKEITAIIPYYGYARQDRKAAPREPITARLIANLLETAGVHRIITFDLHTDQIQGFFNIPVDHLSVAPVLAQAIKAKKLNKPIIVTPDVGGTKRARRLAALLNLDLAIIDKRRTAANESEILNLIGNVEGKSAILVDDMIDTAGTISNAAQALKTHGAKDVYVCATHAILSDPAIERLSIPEIKEIIVTDSIELAPAKKIAKINIVSLAPFVASAIKCVFEGKSVGEMIQTEFKFN